MFASASAHIFAQADMIFDGKISNCRSHRLLLVKAVGSRLRVLLDRESKVARGLSWRREVYFIKMLRQIFWFAGTRAAAIREITCDQRARFTHDASPT